MIRLCDNLQWWYPYQRPVVHAALAHAPLLHGDKPTFQLLPRKISPIVIVEVSVYGAVVVGHVEHQDRGEECICTQYIEREADEE